MDIVNKAFFKMLNVFQKTLLHHCVCTILILYSWLVSFQERDASVGYDVMQEAVGRMMAPAWQKPSESNPLKDTTYPQLDILECRTIPSEGRSRDDD